MQTKFLLYIIIGILVVAGIAGASWYFTIRQPTPPAPPVVTPPVSPPVEKPPGEPQIISINVISPDGGEVWQTGRTYDILWESNGVDKADIFLFMGEGRGGGATEITQGVSAAQGKYSWYIPSDWLLYPNFKNTYKIWIGASGMADTISDTSDHYFDIISEYR